MEGGKEMLSFGSLHGYQIEKAELRDSLNCLNSANDSRAVLHYELINSSELSDDKKQYISEYMREIRYWTYLAYQIVLRELRKQSDNLNHEEEMDKLSEEYNYRMRIGDIETELE